jgi:hypothetical protein
MLQPIGELAAASNGTSESFALAHDGFLCQSTGLEEDRSRRRNVGGGAMANKGTSCHEPKI